MTVGAFKASLSATSIKVEELAGAAALAYDAHGATKEIRKTIIDVGIDGKLLSTTCDNALSRVMTQYPELAKEYAQALEAKLARLQGVQSAQANARCDSKRYQCPAGCGGTMSVNHTASLNMYLPCSHCRTKFSTLVWRSLPVPDV